LGVEERPLPHPSILEAIMPAPFVRAKRLLQTGGDFSLAEVAAHAGFLDQSQFCQHFKRLVGVTPGQFRMPARIA
jgi:transcriptional regulator GlxA family with amidase domain